MDLTTRATATGAAKLILDAAKSSSGEVFCLAINCIHTMSEGCKDETDTLIECDALTYIFQLLKSKNANVVEKALLILGNIASLSGEMKV